MDASQVMSLTIALPYRDLAGMQKFVDDVSNPTSPNYRHFITPQQVAERFGPSADTVRAVEDYFTAEGLKIGFESRNGLAIQVSGTVTQMEHAFSTTFNDYKANNSTELGRSSYYSYATKLTVPTEIAPNVQYVSGATNFYKPKPMTTLSPSMARTLYNDAGLFAAGNTGAGRKLGMLNFDGYGLSNVPLYYSHYSLPVPAGGVGTNVHQVPINGGNGNAQSPGGEGDLDIQALCGQAPLGDIYIYDDAGDPTGDILATVTKVMSDNTVDVCSASYGFSGPSTFFDSLHSQYLSGNAEGITCMFSSGDSGASIQSFPYADNEPEILSIGGTVATTDGSGNRTTETTWNEGSGLSGGGGWTTTTNSFNVLPSWQHGTGVPVSNNHRLVPDVAGHAGGPGGAYQVYIGGSLFALDGTSASSPVFTGQLAIASSNSRLKVRCLPTDLAITDSVVSTI